MFVKPAPGLKIHYPMSRRYIPEAGLEVTEEGYWLDMVRHGDLVLSDPPAGGGSPTVYEGSAT